MFGNKNTLPPRPKPPSIDEIAEDLISSANKDDIAFKILTQEPAFIDNSEPHDLNNIYNKVKTYLDVNKKLKILEDSIIKNEEQLQSSITSMLELKEEIKEQAQAALIQ
ncbi:uncharacterized protein LOC131674579 [Phymastichus coffea]|uniref:uncharacterized protein LOC131674579 n=1 Tax=Phymastichus coffea TaxID=108790 RepID=UPI00273BC3A9|nr:uncharacterized protein LOC131674579 [Phymastichus coffea]